MHTSFGQQQAFTESCIVVGSLGTYLRSEKDYAL
jgi:hypothetical protein